MAEPAPPPSNQRWTSRLRAYLSTPDTPALLEDHRRTVLLRTRAAALIASVVIPFTIIAYLKTQHPDQLERGAWVSLWAELCVFLIIAFTYTRPLQRHFHLPFFLLVGVVCTVTEAVMLQLTGGGGRSNFLFPYFLVLFGIATLFPSKFLWGFAAAAMSPISYVVSEIYMRGKLQPGMARANLILLVDYAFIAAFASRVTTRLFFSEAEYRLRLENANKQLRELDRAKSDFFANISHDLRSPLTVILGPLTVLSADKEKLEPRHLHYLQLALGGAAKLDSMINDLLELARIDAGVGKLRLSRVDVREMVSNLLESSTPYAQSLGLKLIFKALPGPLFATVDSDKLERVAMNLLSNACKFSTSGTTVTVELNDHGPDLELIVQDQGPGISEGDQARIFGRFARGKEETHTRTRGTGLGLAVVREFVELHGGQVSVASTLGKGARFRVFLPGRVAITTEAVSTDSAGATVLRSRAPARLLMSGSQKVAIQAPPDAPVLLVVEDTDEVRSFLEVELASDFRIHTAPDGREALKQLEMVKPDAVLLDVMIPDVDGMEVCREIRRNQPHRQIPVLMYSARGDMQTRLDAFAAGADDFMPKPFEPRELKARLESLLRRSHWMKGNAA